MRRRVGIIGMGWVGASVAIATLMAGVADELLLADARTAVAEGEAMDMAHGAAYEIIARKGATNHAIGLVTADLLTALIRDEHRMLTVSRVHGASLNTADGSILRTQEVALSVPALVGLDGAFAAPVPALEPVERQALQHSADVLRAALDTLA
jgi:malate/lactate dehydrogenase